MHLQQCITKSRACQGFAFSELAIVVAIIGILSSIAIPSYLSQLLVTRQRGCAATLSMVLTSTMLFNDEFATPPRHWADLHTMSPILTSTGTAANITNFNPITLRNNEYRLLADVNEPIYIYECRAADPNASDYNAIGCVNIDTGATDVVLGRGDAPATAVNCNN